MTLRLASRGSTLALWQAQHVRSLLGAMYPDLVIEIDVLHTTGDRITDVPLAMIGDRGLFTKEVDNAVLDGTADFAVHSFKDVPTKLTDGLMLAAVIEREDPRDAFLPAPGRPSTIAALPPRARIGTSSLRRRALLLAARPDLVVEDLRGNLDTRLRKLEHSDYDGIIVALAGLRRLGGDDRAGELLDMPHWLPAAGQGALALIAREDDPVTPVRLSRLDNPPTRVATEAERAFLGCLEGGCQIPIGALGVVRDSGITLHGLVASLDGATVLRGDAHGTTDDARAVGVALAAQLDARGAGDVLRAIRYAADVPRPAAP